MDLTDASAQTINEECVVPVRKTYFHIKVVLEDIIEELQSHSGNNRTRKFSRSHSTELAQLPRIQKNSETLQHLERIFKDK